MSLERYHLTSEEYGDALQQIKERFLILNEPGVQGIYSEYDRITNDDDHACIDQVSSLLNPADRHGAYVNHPDQVRRVVALGMTAGLLIDTVAYDNYALTLASIRPVLLPTPEQYDHSFRVRRRFASILRSEASHALGRAGIDVVDWLEHHEAAVTDNIDHQPYVRFGAGIVMACNYRLHDQLMLPDPDEPIDWDAALRRVNGDTDYI